jgi:hypothetical protein
MLFQVYFIEMDINMVPANIKFSNMKSVSKLPWIGHIVTSPAALECSDNYKVSYFKVGELSFHSVGEEKDFDTKIFTQNIVADSPEDFNDDYS